jgi:hypothetical protein
MDWAGKMPTPQEFDVMDKELIEKATLLQRSKG